MTRRCMERQMLVVRSSGVLFQTPSGRKESHLPCQRASVEQCFKPHRGVKNRVVPRSFVDGMFGFKPHRGVKNRSRVAEICLACRVSNPIGA